jgi:hypothetical protein
MDNMDKMPPPAARRLAGIAPKFMASVRERKVRR